MVDVYALQSPSRVKYQLLVNSFYYVFNLDLDERHTQGKKN